MALVTTSGRALSNRWRRHFTPIKPDTTLSGRAVGNAPIALLTFLTLVGCGVAVIALGQLKSLKTDLAEGHRDVLYLRERLAKLEQAEKANALSDRHSRGATKA